jgi:PilZ domain
MNDLRQHPRRLSPKGVFLAWQSTQQKIVSHLGNLCLGGLFIRTQNPPSPGTSIQLLMDTPTGEVRARALVRSARPKIGMGVKFISMLPEHRARLGRWLNTLSA